MTENEAIKTINDAYETFFALQTKPDFDTAMAVAIKALEEIQQYKATGLTPEQVRKLQMDFTGWLVTLDEYRAIGTIEECRTAMEKTKPTIKPVFLRNLSDTVSVWKCNCGAIIKTTHEPGILKGNNTKFCSQCGCEFDFGSEEDHE